MKLVEMWDYGSKYVQEIKNPGGGGNYTYMLVIFFLMCL